MMRLAPWRARVLRFVETSPDSAYLLGHRQFFARKCLIWEFNRYELQPTALTCRTRQVLSVLKLLLQC
jgi:hypothetical protein